MYKEYIHQASNMQGETSLYASKSSKNNNAKKQIKQKEKYEQTKWRSRATKNGILSTNTQNSNQGLHLQESIKETLAEHQPKFNFTRINQHGGQIRAQQPIVAQECIIASEKRSDMPDYYLSKQDQIQEYQPNYMYPYQNSNNVYQAHSNTGLKMPQQQYEQLYPSSQQNRAQQQSIYLRRTYSYEQKITDRQQQKISMTVPIENLTNYQYQNYQKQCQSPPQQLQQSFYQNQQQQQEFQPNTAPLKQLQNKAFNNKNIPREPYTQVIDVEQQRIILKQQEINTIIQKKYQQPLNNTQNMNMRASSKRQQAKIFYHPAMIQKQQKSKKNTNPLIKKQHDRASQTVYQPKLTQKQINYFDKSTTYQQQNKLKNENPKQNLGVMGRIIKGIKSLFYNQTNKQPLSEEQKIIEQQKKQAISRWYNQFTKFKFYHKIKDNQYYKRMLEINQEFRYSIISAHPNSIQAQVDQLIYDQLIRIQTLQQQRLEHSSFNEQQSKLNEEDIQEQTQQEEEQCFQIYKQYHKLSQRFSQLFKPQIIYNPSILIVNNKQVPCPKRHFSQFIYQQVNPIPEINYKKYRNSNQKLTRQQKMRFPLQALYQSYFYQPSTQYLYRNRTIPKFLASMWDNAQNLYDCVVNQKQMIETISRSKELDRLLIIKHYSGDRERLTSKMPSDVIVKFE